ncbi:MAG: trypsin-like peptidase domain-containing protein [Kofleriaceae bacterium]
MGTQVASLAERLVVLTDGLADLYPFKEDALRIARAVELPVRTIRWSDNPLVTWDSVLRFADEHAKLHALVEHAVKDQPKHQCLAKVAAAQIMIARGPDLVWKPSGHEAIVAESDLLPISFLERGAQLSSSVARIVRADLTMGTGFLLAGGLLVTNNHVLSTEEHATEATVELDYEHGKTPVILRAAAHLGFATSVEHDWTCVRIEAPASFGALAPPIDPPAAVDDRVTIIQHPNGEYKQVALHANKVAFANETRVQYFTDTMPGSSGAPVFDLQWRWVALHHSGGRIREPGTNTPVYRNEGIVASVVYAGIVAAGLVT